MMNFIRAGNGDRREDRPKSWYPIAVNSQNKIRILKMEWDEETQDYKLLERPAADETLVYPVKFENGQRIEKRWQRGYKRVATEYEEYRVRRANDGDITIDFKTRMDDEAPPVTWWDKGEYASANYGASELKDFFGEKTFDFRKLKSLSRMQFAHVARQNLKVLRWISSQVLAPQVKLYFGLGEKQKLLIAIFLLSKVPISIRSSSREFRRLCIPPTGKKASRPHPKPAFRTASKFSSLKATKTP